MYKTLSKLSESSDNCQAEHSRKVESTKILRSFYMKNINLFFFLNE